MPAQTPPTLLSPAWKQGLAQSSLSRCRLHSHCPDLGYVASQSSLYCWKHGKMELRVSVPQTVVRTSEVTSEKHRHISAQSVAATMISRTGLDIFKTPKCNSYTASMKTAISQMKLQSPVPLFHKPIITST